MKVDIEDEKVNRLLQRTELRLAIDTEGTTPSRCDIAAHIAAKKGVKESQIVVDRVDQEHGAKKAKVYVKVYSSEKALKSVEPEYKLKRTKDPKKEEKKEE
ncbi:MAG: hypothetical protein JW834_00490 [Candidatus Diapherotrites archaeon]|nr:hypothetical protein [Candidatus Diapherotrites archaeon]